MLDLGKTSYKDLVFALGEFLRLVGAQKESLGIILIYYMLKYWFGIKKLSESHFETIKTHLKDRFRQN